MSPSLPPRLDIDVVKSDCEESRSVVCSLLNEVKCRRNENASKAKRNRTIANGGIHGKTVHTQDSQMDDPFGMFRWFFFLASSSSFRFV